jgi:PleD family two-component response regulator
MQAVRRDRASCRNRRAYGLLTTGIFKNTRPEFAISNGFKPISLLIIDIDHFKKSMIHMVILLATVFKKGFGIIRKTIRNIGIPARYGGEVCGHSLGSYKRRAENSGTPQKICTDARFSAEQNAFNVTVASGCRHMKEMRKKETLSNRQMSAVPYERPKATA